MTFVDLTKAFDIVIRDAWTMEIMAKFGCPARFIAMVWQFHDGMQTRVQYKGEFSELFEVTNVSNRAVRVTPHTLFSMVFSVILTGIFHYSDTSIPIRDRFNVKLFNPILYVDYMDENASLGTTIKRAVDQVSQRSYNQHKKDKGFTPTSTWKVLP